MAVISMVHIDETSNLGPKAPKDPVKKRSGFYIMLDSTIEAISYNGDKPSQQIFLAERLVDQAKFIGCITDEKILKLLENCEGFHQLVHSIGVTVNTEAQYTGTVNFELQNWGKVDKYESGTRVNMQCPTDGSELLIKLDEVEWSQDDDVLGKFVFEFENVGAMATASVIFYLNDDYEVPEIAVDPPVAFESEEYKTMIAKSLLSRGNNRRLKAAIEKAQKGEDVTIAYIGGSITQGAGAKPVHEGNYAYKSFLKFKEMFVKDGGENVHFVKAGVGGTSSEVGIIRYERDVLKSGVVEPDIVIVEFAVNDEGDETKGICYESLCLKILSAENKPGVILLFSVFSNDWNLQDRLAPVGKHYNLPMVSIKDAVVEQFKLTKLKGNVISKRQFFYDIYHPTSDGHTVMADCLANLFAQTDKGDKDLDDIIIDRAPVIGNSFAQIHLIDRKDNECKAVITEGGFKETDTELQMAELDDNSFPSPQFPYNWMHTASSGNESFKMNIKSRSFIMVFKDSGSSEFGRADIFVDGKHVNTVDPHIANWTHCNAVILYCEEVRSEHMVEVRMFSGDEDKCFTILGFGYTM